MLAANNIKLLEPTVLYLDEEPPKIVKSKKSRAGRKAKKPTKKKEIKKIIIKPQKKSKNLRKTVKEYFIKNETSLNEYPDDTEKNKNDPLYTPKLEVKLELDVNKLEPEIEIQSDNKDQNYEPNEQDEEVTDDDDKDVDFDGEISDDDDDEDDDDEDEPLILLTRSKSSKVSKVPEPAKCGSLCKQHCIEKFSEEQRNLLCKSYWNLNKANRRAFLRDHMRLQSLLKYSLQRRSVKYSYYLKDSQNNANNDFKLIKVCHKYFKSTLNVGEYCIKRAITGYKLEEDQELLQLTETIKANKEREKALAQQIKQHLDPVTGNLIIIDPKNKTKKSSDMKPKKKHKRRKPGDPLPKRLPKPINCEVKCIFKCHTKFSEEERKLICDSFWSLDFKRRKDFILSNVEVQEIERHTVDEFRITNRAPRSHQLRYFLRTKMHGEKIRVCRHFMNNTLVITRSFIENAIEFADQSTGCYKGFDRRGQHVPSTKHPEERLKVIVEHISSFPKWVPHMKSKTKYLHHTLSIKKMFDDYKANCDKEGSKSVSSIYYYKFFHDNFRLMFLKNPHPKKKGSGINQNPNISQYTGEEPGGIWLDPNDEKLNLRLFNPAQSMQKQQLQQQPNYSINSNSSLDDFTNTVNPSTSLQLNPLNYATAATAHHLASLLDPTIASMPHSSASRFRMV